MEDEAEKTTENEGLVTDGSGVEKRIENRGRIGRWPANDYY